MVKLSPRLQCIADRLLEVNVVADVGTDHAYLPIWLVENARVERAIASDVNRGPLENARQMIEEAQVEELIDLRLGSGCEPYVPGEVDAFVLAGMGGLLISQLLQTADAVVRSASYLIVQPMQAQAELREWLSENHYKILSEAIAQEGDKFYEILKVRSGEMGKLSWEQKHLGYAMEVDEAYIGFLKHKEKVQLKVMAGLEKGKRFEALKEAEVELKAIQEVLACALMHEN